MQGIHQINQKVYVAVILQNLPLACVASTDEVLGFIGSHALHGLGIGYVDACLLASARLTPGCVLWTLDKRLTGTAERLGVAAGSLH